MSEENTVLEELKEEEVVEKEYVPTDEETIAKLRSRLDLMGIKYHHKAGISKLQGLIEKGLAPPKEKEEEVIKPKTQKVEYLTKAEFKRLQLQRRKRKAGSLIRIRATCMNPNKKKWEGEFVSVGSNKLGTFKKYVLFNAEDGWHVPYIMYEAMKERKCTIFVQSRDDKGNKVAKGKLIPEFSIEVLPPLTLEELKTLAAKQAAGHNLD